MQMYMKLTSNLENMINHIYHTPLPETLIPCSSLCPPMSQRKFWMLQSVFIKTSHVYPFFGIQKTVPGTFFWPKVPSCCIFHNSSRVSSQDHPQWRDWAPGMMSMRCYDPPFMVTGTNLWHRLRISCTIRIHIYIYMCVYIYIRATPGFCPGVAA